VRLHKVINRVHRGTTYYRWVLAVPPREVRNLGWVDGQRLDLFVQGASLTLHPSRYSAPRLGRRSSEDLREVATEKAGRRSNPAP